MGGGLGRALGLGFQGLGLPIPGCGCRGVGFRVGFSIPEEPKPSKLLQGIIYAFCSSHNNPEAVGS